MITKIKTYLGFPVPAWLVVVMIFVCFYIANISRVKPPEAWIEFSLKSIEKIDDNSKVISKSTSDPEIKEYTEFIRGYMFLQLIEYKQIYRMFYGELPEQTKLQIDTLEKKMLKKD